MDYRTTAFHTSKPSHLALGKLMNSYLKTPKHVFITCLPHEIFCDKFVFQAIVDEIFCWNTPVKQSFNFSYHTIFKAPLQSITNLGTPCITINIHPYNHRINRREHTIFHGMFKVVTFYFNSTDGTLARVNICLIMHLAPTL